MKHAFQSSILCNESEFPTYPHPSGTTGRSTTKRTLNWSFVDGSTLTNPINVSIYHRFNVLIKKILSFAFWLNFSRRKKK